MPMATPRRLEHILSQVRAELARIEADHAAGHVDLNAALALAMCAGIEHARRLMESSTDLIPRARI